MPRACASLATLLAVGLAVTPGLAFARVGGGSSFGSRGGMTFSSPPSTSVAPYSAAPMQRSYTQPSPSLGAPGMGSSGYAAQGYGGRSGMFGGGFTSGLMGGLLGAGIGGMLFGHGMFGGMDGGGGSFLGLIIQLALLFFVGRWLLRMFMNRQPALAGMGAMRQSMAGAPPRPPSGGSAPPPITLSNADYTAFDQLLVEMQGAWSAQDLTRLRAIATPEMTSYFSEQLSELTSRGLRNTVRDVRLQKGDLAQAWAEGSREYATVAMQFSMFDVTQDAQGRVVDGSTSERQMITELWTFLRSRGGNWVLSAIQQAR